MFCLRGEAKCRIKHHEQLEKGTKPEVRECSYTPALHGQSKGPMQWEHNKMCISHTPCTRCVCSQVSLGSLAVPGLSAQHWGWRDRGVTASCACSAGLGPGWGSGVVCAVTKSKHWASLCLPPSPAAPSSSGAQLSCRTTLTCSWSPRTGAEPMGWDLPGQLLTGCSGSKCAHQRASGSWRCLRSCPGEAGLDFSMEWHTMPRAGHSTLSHRFVDLSPRCCSQEPLAPSAPSSSLAASLQPTKHQCHAPQKLQLIIFSTEKGESCEYLTAYSFTSI